MIDPRARRAPPLLEQGSFARSTSGGSRSCRGSPARASLEIGGAPGFRRAPGWLALLAGASPIAWAWRPAASPWLAVAVCAVLAVLAGAGRSKEAL
jgi:hypothetical protein